MARIKTSAIAEFGDFQTPESLAKQVCALLAGLDIEPESIVEPTCGRGAFVFAAADCWPASGTISGFELSAAHHATACARAKSRTDGLRIDIKQDDFFKVDWPAVLGRLPEPILVIGNPPWVTNAHVSSLGGSNVPVKSNFQGHSGFDAITGKANFDISEWMLIKLAEAITGRDATLAMLVKTAVARKLLLHCWTQGVGLSGASMYRIDAAAHFGAVVEASLVVLRFGRSGTSKSAPVFGQLSHAIRPVATIALAGNTVVADLVAYEQTKHLGGGPSVKWRSGIKHDCSRVMELRREGNRFRNGLGDLVELEPDYVFPMLKTSEVAGGRAATGARCMLVPQRRIGDCTMEIEARAPRTWQYLQQHHFLLSKRGSSIYRGKPSFSIFGVGDYSFAPWKIAISGMYKSLRFMKVGPCENRPVVFDDTTNFLPCPSEASATLLLSLLESDVAIKFYRAFVFWDAKRPITVELLCRLNLHSLANELGLAAEFEAHFGVFTPSRRREPSLPRQRTETPTFW